MVIKQTFDTGTETNKFITFNEKKKFFNDLMRVILKNYTEEQYEKLSTDMANDPFLFSKVFDGYDKELEEYGLESITC